MSKPRGKDISNAGAAAVDGPEHEEFLARWSKRKALAREGVDLPEPADDVAAEGAALPDGAGGAAKEPPPDPAAPLDDRAAGLPELPSLESLGENSDYGAFMADGVPADLQRKALRKLFQSPKFNVRDGLDDYDLDFSSPEPLGGIVTAEMRHRLRRELERLAGLDDEEDGPQDAAPAADAQVADNHGQEQPADSEPDDDPPATA